MRSHFPSRSVCSRGNLHRRECSSFVHDAPQLRTKCPRLLGDKKATVHPYDGAAVGRHDSPTEWLRRHCRLDLESWRTSRVTAVASSSPRPGGGVQSREPGTRAGGARVTGVGFTAVPGHSEGAGPCLWPLGGRLSDADPSTAKGEFCCPSWRAAQRARDETGLTSKSRAATLVGITSLQESGGLTPTAPVAPRPEGG